jgi:hypothetical protein
VTGSHGAGAVPGPAPSPLGADFFWIEFAKHQEAAHKISTLPTCYLPDAPDTYPAGHSLVDEEILAFLSAVTLPERLKAHASSDYKLM